MPLEVGGALRLRLEAESSRQGAADRGQRTEDVDQISETESNLPFSVHGLRFFLSPPKDENIFFVIYVNREIATP
jgi:hypothetical protein